MKKKLEVTDFVKRQLPLIDVVDDKSTWFALRMTPYDKYTGIELEAFIKTFSDTYVFTQEVSSKQKEHYHCVVNTKLEEFDLREKIREYLRIKFGVPKRGDANKQYNLSECIDVELSVVYILKDGGPLFYNNFQEDGLKKLSKKSYVKFDREDFGIKLKELKDSVKNDPSINIEGIMVKIVNLKTMFRQPINLNYIYQLSSSLYLHNHPTQISDYVKTYPGIFYLN